MAERLFIAEVGKKLKTEVGSPGFRAEKCLLCVRRCAEEIVSWFKHIAQ